MGTKAARPPVRRQPRTGKPSRARASAAAGRAALGVDQIEGCVFRLVAWGKTSSTPEGADPRPTTQATRGGLDDVFTDVGVVEPQGFASGIPSGALGPLVSVGDSGEQAAIICPSSPGDRPTYIAGTNRAVVVSTPHDTRVYLDPFGNIELGTQADLDTEATEDKGARVRLSSSGVVEIYGEQSAAVRSAPQAGSTFSRLLCDPDGSAQLENHQNAAVVLRVVPDDAVQLFGKDVYLAVGAGLGTYLGALDAALASWTPVANDGGAALKAALAPLLALTVPGGA